MKKLGLRTKLNFRFNTEDMEDIPVMDFVASEPVEKKEEIKIVKKKRRNTRKKDKELF